MTTITYNGSPAQLFTTSVSANTLATLSASTTHSNGIECTGTISASDLLLKGKSISDRLDAIEKRLMILQKNIELESEWDELRELGDKYKLLEENLIEKQKIYAILKK